MKNTESQSLRLDDDLMGESDDDPFASRLMTFEVRNFKHLSNDTFSVVHLLL